MDPATTVADLWSAASLSGVTTGYGALLIVGIGAAVLATGYSYVIAAIRKARAGAR